MSNLFEHFAARTGALTGSLATLVCGPLAAAQETVRWTRPRASANGRTTFVQHYKMSMTFFMT